MNNKILAICIVCFSFLSWILWSYIFSQINIETSNKNNDIKVIQNSKNISITDLQNEITHIVDTVSPSVVNIIITKDMTIYKNDPFSFFRQPVGSVNTKVWGWTWFFITKDGIILTNKHVIDDPNAQYTVILQNSEEYQAKVLALDPLSDLAVMKIEAEKEFQPVEFIQHYEGKYWEIKIGQFAIAIGNALAEFKNSVALWVISGSNRTIEAQWDKLSWLLQTDAAINPGNSGGPLVNLDGKVMWINTAISWNAQWIWFAIPLSTAKINYILDSIKNYWEIKKPFIWINYTLINDQSAKQFNIPYNYWAYILERANSVVDWSSAQKAWLQPWDVILTINGIKITPTNDLISFIQNKIPWEELQLEVFRNNKTINIKLILGLEK